MINIQKFSQTFQENPSEIPTKDDKKAIISGSEIFQSKMNTLDKKKMRKKHLFVYKNHFHLSVNAQNPSTQFLV